MDEQLKTAIEQGDGNQVARLLADRPQLAEGAVGDTSAILFALYLGHEEIARRLAAARERSLDHYEAAALGEVGRLAEALDADPGSIDRHAADGFTAVALAAFFGRAEAVRLLVTRGADLDLAATNRSRVRPLHSAVAHRDRARARQVAALLLAAGADPNVEQEGGWTPLHAAAMHGDGELVALLLAHGAAPGTASVDGKTAADLAREGDHPAVVELLAG